MECPLQVLLLYCSCALNVLLRVNCCYNAYSFSECVWYYQRSLGVLFLVLIVWSLSYNRGSIGNYVSVLHWVQWNVHDIYGIHFNRWVDYIQVWKETEVWLHDELLQWQRLGRYYKWIVHAVRVELICSQQ
jgi:hypothetical protein